MQLSEIAPRQGKISIELEVVSIDTPREFQKFGQKGRVATAIVKEMGLKERRIEKVADRPGHDFRYALDSDRIRRLGWEPDGTFDGRLRETIEWYKRNRRWWKKIKI